MKESILISITIVLIYIFLFINNSNLKLIEANGNKVLVRALPDCQKSGQLLILLIQNMYKLRDHLVKNKNNFPEQSGFAEIPIESIKYYIEFLANNFNQERTLIYENSPDSEYTSYSVNKGEEFVFCLKCKITKKLHNINLLVYVAVHEMAHAGCPEIGHTPLFNKIFRFFLEQAIQIGIYKYEDYSSTPVNYCGLDLYTNILN